MDPLVVLGIVTALLIVLLLAECPIAFALALSGFAGLALSGRAAAGEAALGATPFTSTAVYGLAVIPLYVLLGMFAFHAKIPEQIYAVAAHLLRRVPGGLGVATVTACAGFASVSGSSVATAATMARISVDEMRSRGYPASFAGGLVATSGGLGMIIPPSIILVVYAFVTGESIARMLVAGIVPGILLAICYSLYTVLRARHLLPPNPEVSDPHDVPAAFTPAHSRAGTDADDASFGFPVVQHRQAHVGPQPHEQELLRLRDLPYGGAVRALILFGIVVAGIQGGLVTVTESGALAVVIALVMLVEVRWREGRQTVLSRVGESLSAAAATTTMALTVVIGASIFSFYLVSSGLPSRLSAWLTGMDLPPTLVVAALLLLLLPLGMFLESLSIILIVVPLAYPIVTSLGFDGVWFGLLVVLLVELGMVTPPVGLNVFVVAEAVPGLSAGEVFRGVLPFVCVTLAVAGLLFAVPEIVLWLPNLITG